MRIPNALVVASVFFTSSFFSITASDDDKNRPVTKVMTLLKDMTTQLEKEATEDEEVYEAMGCWCETNEKEKTKAISDAQQRISDLTAAVEEYTALSSRLHSEIKNLEQEVARNSHALDQATALRKKQLAQFNDEEKDMLQSISALKSAVVVVSKQHAAEGSAFLQDVNRTTPTKLGLLRAQSDSSVTMKSIAALLKDELKKHSSLLSEVISPHQRVLVRKFYATPEGFLQSHAPASGELFGILKQMKETFQANLATAQKEETQNQKSYEDLKAAKQEEIEAGQQQVDTKTVEHATSDEKRAVSKEDLEDTSKTLAADQEFLRSVKEQCAGLDAQYEERTKTRQQEIQATSKALAFLSGDDAHDLFAKTFNPALLQRGSSSKSSRRENAAALLSATARKLKDPRLSTLASHARLDVMAKVKASINELVETLLKEKADEIKHKDYCVEKLHQNEQDIAEKQRSQSSVNAQIDDLKSTMDELTRDIDLLKSQIAEMHVQMKRAGEDREKENANFQMEISDQRATQKLLSAALGVLKGFYNKPSAALVQKKEAQPEDAAPPKFKPMEKNAASGGVMMMIQNIIHDAKTMEAEAIHGEEQAQKAYEAFVKDTNNSIEQNSKDLINKAENKGKTEAALVEMKKELSGVTSEIETLYSENADLHKDCDFVMKNFEIRQSTRDEEIEALRQSVAMLSGATFSAL